MKEKEFNTWYDKYRDTFKATTGIREMLFRAYEAGYLLGSKNEIKKENE